MRRGYLLLIALVTACRSHPPVQPDATDPPETAPPATTPHVAVAPSASATDATAPLAPPPKASVVSVGPGFPEAGPWVSFYGNAGQMGDLAKVARTFRVINIDADPGANNFTDAQLAVLKSGGKNKVLSYFNIGACENYRSYWSKAPQGLLSCAANKGAQRGKYAGYADETWMDLGDEHYQRLLLDHVAPRLASRVDGFYLDNMEILEHGSSTSNGPCNAACKQGGLDFVRKLREKFPTHLIVMQNATSDVTRLGTTGGVPFPTLLDGIAHEEVYAPKYESQAESELLAWKGMGIRSKDGHPFWIATEDYAGNCHNKGAALGALARSKHHGFSPYVSDESGGQKVVCYWE